MKNIGQLFDKMLYWNYGKKKITFKGTRVEDRYEIKIIKVEGEGERIPYDTYSQIVEIGRETIEEFIEKHPEEDNITSIVEDKIKIADPLGFLRLLNKIGVVKLDRIE